MQKNKAAEGFYGPSTLALVITAGVALLHLLNFESMGRPAIAYTLTAALTLVVIGVPAGIYCFLKNDSVFDKFIPEQHQKGTALLTVFGAVLFIAQSSILKFGIFGVGRNYSVYGLYGSDFSLGGGFFANLLAILTLAVLPAVLEEVVFRGIIFSEYARRGFLCGAVFSSMFSAFLQFDLQNFAVYFVGGLLLSWIVFLSGSVIPAVIIRAVGGIFAMYAEKYVWLVSSNCGSRLIFWIIAVSLSLVSLIFIVATGENLILKKAESGLEAPVALKKNKIFTVFFSALTAIPTALDILLYFAVSLFSLIFAN